MNREEIRKKWKNRELAEISQKKLARQEDTQTSPTKQVVSQGSSWERVQNRVNQSTSTWDRVMSTANKIANTFNQRTQPYSRTNISVDIDKYKQMHNPETTQNNLLNNNTNVLNVLDKTMTKNNYQPPSRPTELAETPKEVFKMKKIEQLPEKTVSNEELENLSQMNDFERNKFLNKTNKNKKEVEKINNQVKNYIVSKNAQENAQKINSDISNGDYGSAIYHILSGLPREALNATTKTVGAVSSLRPGQENLANVTKAMTKGYQETTSQIENPLVRTGAQVTGAVGNMIPGIASNIVAPGSGIYVNAVNVGTSEYLSTLNEEQTNKLQAILTGVAKGAVSKKVEELAGGNIFSEGSFDDVALNGIAKIKSDAVRWLASKGYEVGGEVAEENIENLIGYAIDSIINNEDITAEQLVSDFKETSKDTALTTLFLDALGLGGNTYRETTQGTINNIIEESNLSDVQKEILTETAEKNGLSKKEVEYLIDNTKNGKYEQNQATTMTNNEILNQEQQTIQQEGKQAQNQMSQEISNIEQKALNLRQSIDNYNNSRTEGQEIFDINNEETRKEIESIQKIAQDRNINIIFDENRFNNTDTNAFYEYDKDNNVANIVLNPNSTSKKYVQNLVIHEMTHSFEGSKQYDSLSKAILDYAKSKGEYDSAFKDLMNTYSKVYSGENLNEIVEKEAVANILGEKLGDKEFVDSLVNNQYVERSTIQKIIDFVKNQINRFKGYKDQEQYWNNVKTLFEDAYNKSEVSKEGLKNSVETRKDGTLLALHNLTADKLKGVLDLGGFPVPSIAITNPDIVGHSEFGDISVVFDKNTIDPTSKKNEVYDRDVWSPTFPSINYDINNADIKKYVSKNLDLDYKDPILHDAILDYFYQENLGKKVENYGLDRTLQMIKDSKPMKYLYLTNVADSGFKPTMKEVNFSSSGDYTNQELQKFLNEYNGEKSLNELSYDEVLGLEKEITGIIKEHLIEEAKKLPTKELQDGYKKYIDEIVNKYKDNYNLLNNFVYSANSMQRNGANSQTIDEDMTLSYVDDAVNKEDFEKWVDNTFGEMFKNAKKGIRNEKELFTYSGNRRSFKQLYDEYNLDNIVKALTRGNTKGGQETSIFGTGFGRISAQTANRFKSIKDIKSNENRLMTREQAEEIIQPLAENLFTKVDELANYYTRKDYGSDMVNHMQGVDTTSEIIEEFAGGKLTADRLKQILSEYNVYDINKIPSNLLNGIVEDLNNIKNLPTDYFEAKPQRAVGLDEVKALVVPNNLDADLKQQLQDRGMRLIEYDPNVEGDRASKLRGAELQDLRFSQETQDAWNNFIEKYFKNEGTGTAIKDMKKLPEMSITKYQEVLDNAKYIPQEDKQNLLSYLKDIKKNKSSLDDFKKIVNDLNNTYKQDNILDTTETYSTGRKEKYQKYLNSKTDYDNSALKNAMDIIPANKQGRRTKEQWLNVAKQIGTEIANKSNQEIEEIAFRTWQDERPSSKESLNRQGNKFIGFNSDEWVNAIYDSVNEQRQYSVDTEQQAENQAEQQNQQPVEQTIKEEKINLLPNKKVESEQTKQRKHYESIMKSSETSKEAKSIAKKLLGTDTYVPDSNKAQLERADQRIGANPDNELNVLTSKIDNGDRLNATDIAVSERLIEYYSKIGDLEKLETAIQNTALAGTQLGQSVQALSLINRQTPVGQVTYIERTIKKLNQEILNNKGYTQNSEGKILNKKGEDVTDKVELFDFTSEMQQKILNSNKDNIDKVLDEVYDELGNQVTKSTHQKIDSWRYFSMLANIRTHLRNIVGNFAMGKTQQVKNLISAGVEDVSGIINPKFERTKTLRRSDKITKEFAKNDIKNVASELGLNSNKYTAQNRLKDNMREFKSDALNSTLGKLYNLNNTLLEVEDGWGLKSAYVRAFSNYITANKLDVKNISDTNLRKARKYAINEAQEATFHQASALASAINQFSARSKVGKAITDSNLPFVKTPINVAKTGLEYNPAGLVYNSVKGIHDLNTGKITVNQYIDNISKGLTGTGISLLGYALAEAGIVKASGGDDDKEKYEKDRGSQAYSIKIGDNTYSLDWLAPVGIPFFVGVEAHEIINEKKKQKTAKSTDDDSLYKQGIQSATNILNAFATSMNPMAEMSMLSGLTSALRSFDQGVGMIGSLIANAGQSYINQFEPTLLKQVARVTDSKQRTTKSTATGTLGKAVDQTKNQIMAGIPGLRQKLPVATDIWGEELENDDNITRRAFETFIAPYTRKDLKTSRLDSELNDLYDKTGETSIYPSKLKKDLTIDNETYKFTNEEYIKYSKDYGQNSYNILSNLVTSNDYQNLSDSDKQKAIEKAYEYAKEVNKVNYAKKINKEDTVETDALYDVMSNIPNDTEKGKYLVYLVETSGDDVKDTEKKSYLLNSNMKDSTKEVIYRNSLGKKDKLYNTLYDIDKVNINGYLDYSSRDIKSDPDEESNVEGDTIYGTKKINVANALNEISNLSLFDKLYIYGKSYKLDSNERKIVDNGIKNSNLTQEEKDEAYKDLSKSNIIKYKDGSYKWK